MFTPRFQITPAARACLEELERDRWLAEHLLPETRLRGLLRREIAVSRASSTTRIEGARLDEQAVDALYAGAGAPQGIDERDNVNAIRTYELVDQLSDQPSLRITEALVRQLNAELIAGAAETMTPGAYRRGQNLVGTFRPPDQGDVPGLMRDLVAWVARNDEHPAVASGIAHLEFVAVHPFWDGNGRTGRALSTLLLQRSALSFHRLLSLEGQLWRTKDRYFAAIELSLGSAYRRDYDATPWVDYWIEALTVEARRATARLTDLRRTLTETYDAFDARGLNRRQAEAIVMASGLPARTITRADYVAVTGASTATATRDLGELESLGLIVGTGTTRDRRYRVPQAGVARRAGEGPPGRQSRRAARRPSRTAGAG